MLKIKINNDFGCNVNHAIIIKYKDGVKNHAPPHKDKIDKEESFFVLSFGTPRRFQLLDTNYIKTDKGRIIQKIGDVIWDKELLNNSILRVSGKSNQLYYHAVPKDKNWKGTPRYSLIFRTIIV